MILMVLKWTLLREKYSYFGCGVKHDLDMFLRVFFLPSHTDREIMICKVAEEFCILTIIQIIMTVFKI